MKEITEITFSWKDPEHYITARDSEGHCIDDEDFDWDDPEWLEIHEKASEIVEKYTSGEYVHIKVNLKTGRARIIGNDTFLLPDKGESDEHSS